MKRVVWMPLVLAVMLLSWGCEDDDDFYDHRPPGGNGSLVVDNNTSDDFDLFVDGVRVSEVKDGRERIFDYPPGVYRVVLDPEDGFDSFREDVDILEGRLTILHVDADFSFPGDFRVFVEVD